jgi:nicotinamide mononucleotide transporter
MRAFPSIDALIAKWREDGVELNPPATEEALARLAAAVGVELPASLRALYQRANGMPDLEMDGGDVSFWAVEKILSEREIARGRDARGEWTDWAIADVLINSHFVALRVRAGAPPSFAVDGFGLEFESLDDLASAYLEDPGRFPSARDPVRQRREVAGANGLAPLEVALLTLASLALLVATGTQLAPFSWTETLGFVTGGACVWLAVRQHILSWPIGLANNALYFAVFFEARLYADMALQAVFFALGCYGWWKWFVRRGGAPLAVTRISRSEVALVLAGVPLATLGLREALIAANGAAPFLDALTTAISLAAQYLLGRKRIENWALWILADAIYVPLYVSRGLHLTAVLYAIFLAMCIVGLRDWLRVHRAGASA